MCTAVPLFPTFANSFSPHVQSEDSSFAAAANVGDAPRWTVIAKQELLKFVFVIMVLVSSLYAALTSLLISRVSTCMGSEYLIWLALRRAYAFGQPRPCAQACRESRP